MAEEDTITPSPGLLNRWDQQQNPAYFEEQRENAIPEETGQPTERMSEQEALERIPSTITMGQLAMAQNTSMGERTGDPTFKAYEKALRTTQNQSEFSFNGHSYYKNGEDTFLRHDEIPGGVMKLDPDAAAKIDAGRIEDAAGDYRRHEYLRKREEWHNTPDTPNAGIDLERSPRSHDPDNGLEREKRILGNARYLSAIAPAAASIATGSYGISLPVEWVKYAASPLVNRTINTLATSRLLGNPPAFSNMQPHIDN